MLSTKLIEFIEDHWEGITSATIRQIGNDPRMLRMRDLPEQELREIGRNVFRNLGHWLTATRAEQRIVEEQYEGLGRVRFVEGIPLHECVRGLQIARHNVVEFIRDHELAQASVSIYAEEELEHSLNDFFDNLMYHEVLGYEMAMRGSSQLAAAR
jgi:hypothetical protein